MQYVVKGLEPSTFAGLRGATDEQLQAAGARRVVADARPGYPCRVALEDAWIGETLILLPYAHHQADSPYRASGPVFVRETALTATRRHNELPESLQTRLLSIRAYDKAGEMVDAEVIEGRDADPVVRTLLGREDIAFLHAHYARRGCYAALIEPHE
jgi:hypothetical protein